MKKKTSIKRNFRRFIDNNRPAVKKAPACLLLFCVLLAGSCNAWLLITGRMIITAPVLLLEQPKITFLFGTSARATAKQPHGKRPAWG